MVRKHVFQKGAWPDLMSIKDPELRELAEPMASAIAEHAMNNHHIIA